MVRCQVEEVSSKRRQALVVERRKARAMMKIEKYMVRVFGPKVVAYMIL